MSKPSRSFRNKSFKQMRAESAAKREAAAHMKMLSQGSYQTPVSPSRPSAPQTGYQPDGSYIDPNGVRMSKAYLDNLNVAKPDHPNKGEKGQRCNRTACQMPGAYWYNHSTRAYYCGTCADLINRDHERFKDSFTESLGHPLLTLDPDFADKAEYRL